jgi:peroxiredoxin
MDAPLNERLTAYNARLKELNFPFAEAYDVLVSRLIEGGIGTMAPNAGELMPPFVLPGPEARLYSMEELLAEGPLVISFNRGHWCPFCRIELLAIAREHEQIASLGARVVSIIPDRQKFAGRLDAETRKNILILSDIDNAYALSLGLVLWLGDRLHELMEGRGHHLGDYQGSDGWFVPLPATFVVARDGRVAARHIDPEFRRRMEPTEIVRILQSLVAS